MLKSLKTCLTGVKLNCSTTIHAKTSAALWIAPDPNSDQTFNSILMPTGFVSGTGTGSLPKIFLAFIDRSASLLCFIFLVSVKGVVIFNILPI
jgi:hypothetical protein